MGEVFNAFIIILVIVISVSIVEMKEGEDKIYEVLEFDFENYVVVYTDWETIDVDSLTATCLGYLF